MLTTLGGAGRGNFLQRQGEARAQHSGRGGARSALREGRRPPCLWDLVSLPLPARARGLRRGRLASALGPRSPARPAAGFPFSPGRRFGLPPRASLFRFGVTAAETAAGEGRLRPLSHRGQRPGSYFWGGGALPSP